MYVSHLCPESIDIIMNVLLVVFLCGYMNVILTQTKDVLLEVNDIWWFVAKHSVLHVLGMWNVVIIALQVLRSIVYNICYLPIWNMLHVECYILYHNLFLFKLKC